MRDLTGDELRDRLDDVLREVEAGRGVRITVALDPAFAADVEVAAGWTTDELGQIPLA